VSISKRLPEDISKTYLLGFSANPFSGCRLINGVAHKHEVPARSRQRRCSDVKSGELLLDGSDNPFLLTYRGNRNGKCVELVSVDLGENRPALDLRCELSELGCQ
jgi:hypothetical protein